MSKLDIKWQKANDLLDVRKNVRDTIYYEVQYLKSLAKSFKHTGNDKMYDELSSIASNIKYNLDLLENAIDESNDAEYDYIQSATGDMLSTMLKCTRSKK